MSKTSYSQFRNCNNNLFTVSGALQGHKHAIEKYWSDGILCVAISSFSATIANAVTIKNFPYKFKVYDVAWQQYARSGAIEGGSIEIYNGTTSNATKLLCGISAIASRGFKRPTLINFNKNTVDTTDTLSIIQEGVTAASGATMKGMLTLYVRPI